MANLIKEELMVRPPKEAREAVARKVGLPMDMPVEEVIPMRAVSHRCTPKSHRDCSCWRNADSSEKMKG